MNPPVDFERVRRILRNTADRSLVRRLDDELSFVGREPAAGSGLLLDSCVYIDRVQGKVPPSVRELMGVRILNHSTVALQELLFAVGCLEPRDRRSPAAVAAIETMIRAMPRHRLFSPHVDVLATASVYAGILARSQGYARDDRRRALNDCVLFLQARKLGLAIVTRNIQEFDLLQQLMPDGRVLFYRT